MKVILLKSGTSLGHAGDCVEVTEEIGKFLTMEREHFDGCVNTKYRVAKPADEAEEVIEMEAVTQAELAAQGKKNVVATPGSEPAIDLGFEEEKPAAKKGKK